LDWDLAIIALYIVLDVVAGGFSHGNRVGTHLLAQMRVGWLELSNSPPPRVLINRIVSVFLEMSV
jgi:hypothetical protein